jgi:hypothetical protein
MKNIWTLSLVLTAASAVAAQSSATAPAAAPPKFDASVPRERQIAVLVGAAPPEVSAKATLYILGPKGYEKAREGTNGFNCIVDREFVTTMEPECFDAEGSRTILLARLRTEQLRALSKTDAEIEAMVREGYKSGQFVAPSKPGIVYMMSKENWVFDPESKKIIHFPGHLMFYAPYMTAKDLGYESDATLPYLVHPGQPDALMIVVPQQFGSSQEDSSNGQHQH